MFGSEISKKERNPKKDPLFVELTEQEKTKKGACPEHQFVPERDSKSSGSAKDAPEEREEEGEDGKEKGSESDDAAED